MIIVKRRQPKLKEAKQAMRTMFKNGATLFAATNKGHEKRKPTQTISMPNMSCRKFVQIKKYICERWLKRTANINILI
jgi:hypothetical protein